MDRMLFTKVRAPQTDVAPDSMVLFQSRVVFKNVTVFYVNMCKIGTLQ